MYCDIAPLCAQVACFYTNWKYKGPCTHTLSKRTRVLSQRVDYWPVLWWSRKLWDGSTVLDFDIQESKKVAQGHLVYVHIAAVNSASTIPWLALPFPWHYFMTFAMLSFSSEIIFYAWKQKNHPSSKQRERSHSSHFQLLLMEKRHS